MRFYAIIHISMLFNHLMHFYGIIIVIHIPMIFYAITIHIYMCK